MTDQPPLRINGPQPTGDPVVPLSPRIDPNRPVSTSEQPPLRIGGQA